MTTKLNQIIAITPGKKSKTQKTVTEVYHLLQKPTLLDGISRTYHPKDEDGEQLPPEKKQIQLKVSDAINKVSKAFIDLFDVVATQDYANCEARGTIKVGDKVILEDVPVTNLLFLEKQLVDLHTFVEKLPTLDPAEVWKYNKDSDSFASEVYDTIKTKKVLKNHRKAEATKEHPEQVETFTEDVIVGRWTSIKFSGAMPAKDKNDILERVEKLQEAVKIAREEANSMEVTQQRIGEHLLRYVFGG